jgi:homoserine dehydrogenase
VSAEDIRFAQRLGYVIKLLAIAEIEGDSITARVHPAMLPDAHPLAAVRDSFNAVFVEGEKVGELMFYGRGAGGDPTATAVVGDLVTVARNLQSGARGVGCTCFLERVVRPIDELVDQYYVRLDVTDKPGVLAQIAAVFGENDVSIKSVVQEGTAEEAQLVFITHAAREGALQASVMAFGSMPIVAGVRSVIRVEGEE